MPNIGIIRQSVQLSWENIRSNKMRTLLTTLGIIIGVTAVISLITIVNGAISTVMDEFSSLGAGTLSVSITGTPLKSGLTENDLESLGELDNVAGLSPTISATGMAARNQDLLDACPSRERARSTTNTITWSRWEEPSTGRTWRIRPTCA